MAALILDTQNATPSYQAVDTDVRPDVVGRSVMIMMVAAATIGKLLMSRSEPAIRHDVMLVERSGTSLNAEPLAPGDLEFWLEKQAFEMIPKDRLTPNEGMFIASKDGNVVDSDTNLEALTDRFFRQFGDVPVYMTKVGGAENELRIDTPFFD